MNNTSPAPRWTRDQIRAARLASLPHLLRRRGLALIELDANNFAVPIHPGLLIKDSYWRWPERHQAGNAIDFFVQILGVGFHDAMREITTAIDHAPPANSMLQASS